MTMSSVTEDGYGGRECNLSGNPARSTGPAVFVGGWALQQLWLFWVAPLLGAALAGVVYPLMAGNPKKSG